MYGKEPLFLGANPLLTAQEASFLNVSGRQYYVCTIEGVLEEICKLFVSVAKSLTGKDRRQLKRVRAVLLSLLGIARSALRECVMRNRYDAG